MTDIDSRITRGSDKVFADLGFPDADERTAKVELAADSTRALDERQLGRAAAARLLGLTEPAVGQIHRRRVEELTFYQLFDHLRRLGYRIEILPIRSSEGTTASRVGDAGTQAHRTE